MLLLFVMMVVVLMVVVLMVLAALACVTAKHRTKDLSRWQCMQLQDMQLEDTAQHGMRP